MTNLNQLIERRQGEATSQMENLAVPAYNELTHEVEHYNKVTDSLIRYITTQTATEAYRQALEDVLAGLYEVDVDKVPTIEQEAWANQYENKCEAFWHGESKGLSNIREQIEELLGKIE
jgi:hypothetical protein